MLASLPGSDRRPYPQLTAKAVAFQAFSMAVQTHNDAITAPPAPGGASRPTLQAEPAMPFETILTGPRNCA